MRPDRDKEIPGLLHKTPPLPDGLSSALERLLENPDSESEIMASLEEEKLPWTAEVRVLAALLAESSEPSGEVRLGDGLFRSWLQVVIPAGFFSYLKPALAYRENRRAARHWLAAGLFGCLAARSRGLAPGLGFCCGYLGDLGRIGLAATYPLVFANVLTLAAREGGRGEEGEETDLIVHERVLFGIDHREAAEWLAEAWEMPLPLRPLWLARSTPASATGHSLGMVRETARTLADYFGFSLVLRWPEGSRAPLQAVPSELRLAALHEESEVFEKSAAAVSSLSARLGL
jgi:hypothetical protein